MKNALILHGTGGNPKNNWFPWLAEQLKTIDYEPWVPQLPQADFPNIKRYNQFLLKENTWNFNTQSILIGHSAGAMAILGLLQALPPNVSVDTCYLVGSFTKDILQNPDWQMLHGLFEEPFDFDYIKQRAKSFVFIHSDDDPYCPLYQAQELTKATGGKLYIVNGQKHFSVGTAGEQYRQFPLLFDLIKNQI